MMENDAMTIPAAAASHGRWRSAAQVLLPAAALAVALVLPWVVKDPAHQNLAILVLMAAQLGVAWNIVGGYAGQISLGQAAFYGLGAYPSTKLGTLWGWNPWLAIPAGGLLAAAISLAIGWPCFRLRGHYFAMATIAVAEIIQIIFNNWDLAGAAVGLTLPMDNQGWGSLVFADKEPYYYLALGLLLLTLLVVLLRVLLGILGRILLQLVDPALDEVAIEFAVGVVGA
jgi:branched-chain amino acid transport system permease protein